jgi:hypothetical protein
MPPEPFGMHWVNAKQFIDKQKIDASAQIFPILPLSLAKSVTSPYCPIVSVLAVSVAR